jgi:Lysophospholipase L1 and related esterases
MNRLLLISGLLNVLLIAAMLFALQRLGGWRYALLKLQTDTAGLYHHRAQHFERLPEQRGAVVFLGDSQTAQAEWHEMFPNGPEVLNRGISGDYVAGLLGRLPEVLRHRPVKIFLLIGVNDLIFGSEIANIEAVYRQIVQKIRSESPDTELYLQSLLPVNNRSRRSGTDNAKVAALNARIAQVARDYALPYIDINAPLQDADGDLAAKFSEDGLHLNGLGYAVWRKEVERWVTPMIHAN